MYCEVLLRHSLKLEGNFINTKVAEKYNLPKSTIIKKIDVQNKVHPKTSVVNYFVVPKKKQCSDFNSLQKQRVCFGGNHTGFGGNLFLEQIPPTLSCPSV